MAEYIIRSSHGSRELLGPGDGEKKRKKKKGGGASFATAATQFNFEEENLMKGDGLFLWRGS